MFDPSDVFTLTIPYPNIDVNDDCKTNAEHVATASKCYWLDSMYQYIYHQYLQHITLATIPLVIITAILLTLVWSLLFHIIKIAGIIIISFVIVGIISSKLSNQVFQNKLIDPKNLTLPTIIMYAKYNIMDIVRKYETLVLLRKIIIYSDILLIAELLFTIINVIMNFK